MPDQQRPDASMELLNSLLRETIDPEYAHHVADPDATSRPWVSGLVGALAGLLFVSYAMTAGAAGAQAKNERASLAAQIEAVQSTNADLSATAAELHSEITALQAARGGSDPAELMLGAAASAIKVSGPGIVITITDDPSRPDAMVVDQDLRLVTNALWACGAEAIAINGHRLSSQTAIRQAGSAITVDYRSISAPYVIEAIGDPKHLISTFPTSDGGVWLGYIAKNYAVKWRLEQEKDLVLEADAGMHTSHAQRSDR